MTFGQLLVELEQLKKNDAKLLECPLTLCEADGGYPLTLAVTLPGRQLFLMVPPAEESDDAP